MNVYVHIPYCRRKCIYCDFYSVGSRQAEWDALCDSLISEARERINPSVAGEKYPSTIYIGGGTPSLMPMMQFQRLSCELRKLVPDVAEFTIEVNPDDVNPENVKGWKDCGVNRVSMGVQTLCNEELMQIGRLHTAEQAIEAGHLLRDNFPNVSLDIMFGLPGQTLKSLSESVNGIVELHPNHISAYSLMYEERTALTRMRDLGKIEEAPEDLSVQMFEKLYTKLEAAGYERYELSNYAQPGFRSIHNSLYWVGVPYIGIGPGAHSYDGGNRRRMNLPDVCAYIRHSESPHETEVLTTEELSEEWIMTRLRTVEGLNLLEFKENFGETFYNDLISKIERIDKRLYILDKHRMTLSPAGIMVSDEVISSLF